MKSGNGLCQRPVDIEQMINVSVVCAGDVWCGSGIGQGELLLRNAIYERACWKFSRWQLRRNIGNKLHFQQHDMVFQLQLALFQATQLQFVAMTVTHEIVDYRIKVAVLYFEFDDAALNIFN